MHECLDLGGALGIGAKSFASLFKIDHRWDLTEALPDPDDELPLVIEE